MEQYPIIEWLAKIRHELPDSHFPEMRPGVIMVWPLHLQRRINREERSYRGQPYIPDFYKYDSWFEFKIQIGYEKDKVIVFHPDDIDGHLVYEMPPAVIAALF